MCVLLYEVKILQWELLPFRKKYLENLECVGNGYNFDWCYFNIEEVILRYVNIYMEKLS